jgi:hypothetical protein
MELIGKSNPNVQEYLMARILCVANMKKVNADKVKKIMENAENQ